MLEDVTSLTREEFAKLWPEEESLKFYDAYWASHEVTEGTDAVREVLESMPIEDLVRYMKANGIPVPERLQEELRKEAKIPTEFLM